MLMGKNVVLLLFESLLILVSLEAALAEVIQVVAPQLRVSPNYSEDLELCYSMKVPDGELMVPEIMIELRNTGTLQSLQS